MNRLRHLKRPRSLKPLTSRNRDLNPLANPKKGVRRRKLNLRPLEKPRKEKIIMEEESSVRLRPVRKVLRKA